MLFQDEINQKLFATIGRHYNMVMINLTEASNKIKSLETENAALKEKLRLLQEELFGKSSEKTKKISSPNNDSHEKNITVAGYTRWGKNKRGKSTDLNELPKVQILHDLKEHEKQCTACQSELTLIGKDLSKKLEVLPLRLYVAEHVCFKYSCRKCETITAGKKEKTAIPKSIAGDSLLVEIIENKYQHHLPLYRQSKMLANYKAPISDNTLNQWLSQIGEALLPIYNTLWTSLLSARYLQVDETPIKILKPDKQGYLWSYFAPNEGRGLIVFEAALTRSGDIAKKRLQSFNGLLQTDAYQGYQVLRQREGIVPLGCLTHARRKFKECLKTSADKDGIAAAVIEQLKPLYELEEFLRKNQYPFRVRKRMRLQKAKPLLKNLLKYIKKNQPLVPPKSKLGEALAYTLKQWPYLIKYLWHGFAQIDTNWVENQIRPIAIGKKNWMFMGHEDSAKIHALFYSLVSSCLLNELNPRIYLHYLITQIHNIRLKKIDPYLLLPHIIDKLNLQTFADNQLKHAKAMLNALEVTA